MKNAYDAIFLVHEDHGQTVGGQDGEQQAGRCRLMSPFAG